MQKITLEYLDDVLVRLAHHSSAIEGNTITLADTITIILHGTIPGSPSKREFYEIENHRGAFDYILAAIDHKEDLSTSLVKDIHAKLMERLAHDAGIFKKEENAILGAEFNTASVSQTPMMMQQWVENTKFKINLANNDDRKIIEAVIDSHIEFEKIHPFSDGNGRTGRMIMNFLLLQNNNFPLIIKGEDRALYLGFLAKEDVKTFSDFASELINFEKDRSLRFASKEANRIEL